MSRNRSRAVGFQHWGLVLFTVCVVLAARQTWLPFAVCTALWVFYLMTVRLSRCRVETQKGLPCRWRVRGFLGTCNFHVGDKWTVPEICRPPGRILPGLIWRRNHPQAGYSAPPDSGGAAVAERARGRGLEVLGAAIGAGSLVAAVASFVRDLVAG
ncbi:hypothetical protein GCM10022222_79820 [Amycolatopsis ultiminotia]|uniref:PH domain-containing protein n=1 Tax=Amycolatopsis ultiminotia TaxID=543629 RepID=A0ABP6YHL4_9PSEU